jgi:hypothetical protein
MSSGSFIFLEKVNSYSVRDAKLNTLVPDPRKEE